MYFDRFKRGFRHIPLLGYLGNTTLRSHGSALTEIFVSFMVSMMPLYISWIVLRIKQDTNNLSVWTLFQNGELFIYASAILAPVFYIAQKERSSLKSFPSRIAFMTVVFGVTVISTSIFTFERIESQVLPDNIIKLSFGIFLFATATLYLALVYNNTFLPNPATEMQKQDVDFAEDVRQHRG